MVEVMFHQDSLNSLSEISMKDGDKVDWRKILRMTVMIKDIKPDKIKVK